MKKHLLYQAQHTVAPMMSNVTEDSIIANKVLIISDKDTYISNALRLETYLLGTTSRTKNTASFSYISSNFSYLLY